jgi:hypothetical protein
MHLPPKNRQSQLWNSIQSKGHNRLGCSSNLSSIKKTESIGDMNYKLFFNVRGTRLSKEFDQHNKNLQTFFETPTKKGG